jgi:hypothetical protein
VFEALVVAAILTNCTLLAMDNHGVRDGSALRRVLSTADVAFAAFFAGEMGLKLVALGGWGTGQGYVSVRSSGSILSHTSRSSRVAKHLCSTHAHEHEASLHLYRLRLCVDAHAPPCTPALTI